MPFENNARLDPSQVEDERGASPGGLGGPGLGGGSGPVIVGGGGIGLLILLVLFVLGVLNPSTGASSPAYATPGVGNATPAAGTLGTTQTIQQCQTGVDANSREDCRIVGYVNSVQDYWTGYFSQHGRQYRPAKLVLFSGSIQGGCGYASEAQGPFYCPVDKKVYLDLSFFQDLQQRFGAQGGSFAQGYVVAHEYGHHVQDLLGLLNTSSGNSLGPEGGSVRTELQADCLAGVWASHAAGTGFLTPPTSAEIADALNAAAAVGDDRIQQETQGRVAPESWTHGSAQQRQHWLETGYHSGDLNQCDTSQGQL
jgi:predicted metalloprotease